MLLLWWFFNRSYPTIMSVNIKCNMFYCRFEKRSINQFTNHLNRTLDLLFFFIRNYRMQNECFAVKNHKLSNFDCCYKFEGEIRAFSNIYVSGIVFFSLSQLITWSYTRTTTAKRKLSSSPTFIELIHWLTENNNNIKHFNITTN